MSLDRDLNRIREDFPTLKQRVYLNSAAVGPPMLPVWNAIKEYWESRLSGARSTPPKAKAEAAKMLNAEETEIAWVSRVVQSFNLIRSMVDFEPGDNVVVTDLAYPSNVHTWLPIRAKGAEVRRVENHNGDIETADFEKTVDDHTKVVAISHTEWASGITYDLKALAEVAHDHGAFLAVDAYQSLGAVKIDAPKTDVDFLFSGATKWLCCDTGAGVFYVRGDLIEAFEPAYQFYEHVEEAFKDGPAWNREDHDNIKDYDKPLVKDARRFEQGTVTETDIVGLHAALSYFNGLGLESIERRVRKLSGYLIDGLRDLGCRVNTPLEPERRAGLVTYHTGSHELNRRSVEELGKQNIVVSLRYTGGVGGVRAATHFFNTEEEIDKLLKAQKALLK
jgi:cysteine desulfurase/selenocysteine lyase